MSTTPKLQPVRWVPPSYDELVAFPRDVQHAIGVALMMAQGGGKHPSAKPLKGFRGAGVLEVVENHDGDTFRAVYTVRFAEVIYMLHAYQKKSKKGIKTPKRVLELIKARLKTAEQDYREQRTEQ
jgi:phage-related protein